MKKRYQNLFFVFGLAMLALMVTQLDFAQVAEGVSRAGYWFFAVLALWFFLYFFNTFAWWIIIRSSGKGGVSFLWLYKITVSGFALNYATPGGLMGGEPYKIMSLKPLIGTERATSSVILHTMTHIYSHFWYWLLACVLCVATVRLTPLVCVLVALTTAFCLLAIWLFRKGYRQGIAASGMKMLSHIPWVSSWAERFFSRHERQLTEIDSQISALRSTNYAVFATAVLAELTCRIVSALEIYFVLLVLMPAADFVQSTLILAFTSLFANMLFFIPLQLGGREGGFLMSASGLGLTASTGIFLGLIIRLRELFWTLVGLMLIRFTGHPTGSSNQKVEPSPKVDSTSTEPPML